MKYQSPAESNENRSNGTDRRYEGVVSGLRYLFHARRKKVRRLKDHRESFFLDHFSLKVFSIILAVILLSVADAFLTLHLIRNGAAEVNPIMAHFLKYGQLPFFAAKYSLTTASLVLLLIYQNVHIFRTKIRAKYLFVFCFIFFASVVLWELYLITYVLE